jgi:ABC-2 type transport system ATP-binding protein
MTPAAALSLQNLVRRFGDLVAVDGLTFDVAPGELFGLVGPDGAGKTTTLRMLAGVLKPTAGDALIGGVSVARNPEAVKHKIAYMSQRFGLYHDLTVRENLEFYADLYQVPRAERARRLARLYEFSSLGPFQHRLAGQLSGGMKQKLALACTLVHAPKLLFLDEPTTGVDPVSRRDFWKILQSLLRERITIVMTTPYLDEAERCTRVAMMNAGKILRVDEPARLKKLMHGEVVEIVCEKVRMAAALLSARPFIREVQTFGDRLNVVVGNAAHDLPLISSALQEHGIGVRSMRTIPPSLENVFISLLTHTEAEA